MVIENIDILTLIPQRPPMIMIDRLVHYDPIVTRSTFLVRQECTFCDGGKLTPAGIIENVAQTCAARIGYINRMSNQEVKIGVIGAIQNLEIDSLPSVGDSLETEISVTATVFNITVVDASVKSNDKVMGKCSMKIALVE